jgi:hypothetical protein
LNIRLRSPTGLGQRAVSPTPSASSSWDRSASSWSATTC